MADNEYYTRPSTNPRVGNVIGSAIQNFLAARQNEQKLGLLKQSSANENPYRSPGQMDLLKTLQSNPYFALSMAQNPQVQQMQQQAMQQLFPTQPGATQQAPAPVAPTAQPSQASDNQAKIAALIEELYQARKAKGDANATV